MTDIWFAPNVQSDVLELATQPEYWPVARGCASHVQLFVQQLLTDEPWEAEINKVGRNTYPAFVENDWFRRIAPLRLAIEAGAVKPHDCDAALSTAGIVRAIARVCAAGGEVAAVTIDEPRQAMDPTMPDRCASTLEQVIDATARFVHAIRAVGVQTVGLWEAYPASSAADIIDECRRLRDAGAAMSHLHIDLDLFGVHDQKLSDRRVADDLQNLQIACHVWQIPLGFAVIGMRMTTPQTYHDAALGLATRIRDWLGHWPDRFIVESWLDTPSQAFPANLPERDPYSHTALLRDVAERVGERAAGGTDMHWTKVKVVGKTLTLAEGPDAGKVLSFGPAGWEAPTPPGTAGPYELCETDGGFATYTPPNGPPGVFPFRPNTPQGVALIADKDPQ